MMTQPYVRLTDPMFPEEGVVIINVEVRHHDHVWICVESFKGVDEETVRIEAEHLAATLEINEEERLRYIDMALD